MADSLWLKATDCSLLQLDADQADPLSLRLVQRLLELSLAHQGSDGLAVALLEEIAGTLRADHAVIAEATPAWHARWHHARRGLRPLGDTLPKSLLGEVLDREAGAARAPAVNSPAYLAACLSFRERPNRVLLIARPREPFTPEELNYAVAAGHYLGLGLEQAQGWDDKKSLIDRLQALVAISKQLVEERETVPLLEHIADQAARLLHCERSSIFIWDKPRQELVGRPALGLPNGELRIPEDKGVVGKCVRTGQVVQEDKVETNSSWNPAIDATSGFTTKSLLCVPMMDAGGERLGALEVLNKKQGAFTPQDVETLQSLAALTTAVLHNVREREDLLRTNTQFQGEAKLSSQIVGVSTNLQALRDSVQNVARTNLPVLILGESGTGKEVVARAIHFNSSRQKQPFVPVNCAAIVESLVESELFGHEKGSFTGADQTRQGKFEVASGGTLFLDEIGELSANGQAKLLRVLEEKAVYHVGGSQPIPIDTRIVAATNRNLAEQVRASKFREDLFYRLSVVTMELLPLRERQEDIMVLAEHFLEQFCRDAGRRRLKFSAEAKRRMEQHNWQGNVRELRNLMERVAFLSAGDKIEAADLAFIRRPGQDGAPSHGDQTLADATDSFQRDHINHAIKRAKGNMTDAAKLLGLHRSNLYRKMKMLGMKVPE